MNKLFFMEAYRFKEFLICKGVTPKVVLKV